jgi:hypothetical protein
MTLHFLSTLKLPPGLTKQLDRILRQCLWRRKDGEPSQSLAAWEMVCKQKMKGGLGVVDFKKQNAALQIKFLDKFYNKRDISWVKLIWHALYQGKVPHAQNLCGSFWWKDVMKQVDNFRGVSVLCHGRGDTALFWSDNGKVNGSKMPMSQRYPMLFSFVSNDQIPMAEVYQTKDLSSLFYLPLSTQAFHEFSVLQEILRDNQLLDRNDVWKYCWGEKYAARSFYVKIHEHIRHRWYISGCGILVAQ